MQRLRKLVIGEAAELRGGTTKPLANWDSLERLVVDRHLITIHRYYRRKDIEPFIEKVAQRGRHCLDR